MDASYCMTNEALGTFVSPCGASFLVNKYAVFTIMNGRNDSLCSATGHFRAQRLHVWTNEQDGSSVQ